MARPMLARQLSTRSTGTGSGCIALDGAGDPAQVGCGENWRIGSSNVQAAPPHQQFAAGVSIATSITESRFRCPVRHPRSQALEADGSVVGRPRRYTAEPMSKPRPTAWKRPTGSWASSPGNRKSMMGNRGRDTRPELALRSMLHAAGLRYRVSAKPLPEMRRTADIVFGPTRVAVFVDGCFWHRCPEHYTAPQTNSSFWDMKTARTVERDRETDARLAEAGWLVLRFWEHEAADDAFRKVRRAVESRRPPPASPGPARNTGAGPLP
ncbi:very short patch repair endonuclease [Streptomyces sp. MAR4 CNX-425]|uniref:very short patch repair endonuclease n=1 Tax=Streptomyces sp. MAR4 CNX-425 TaxID=3406343 RepID=UPI003B5100C1